MPKRPDRPDRFEELDDRLPDIDRLRERIREHGDETTHFADHEDQLDIYNVPVSVSSDQPQDAQPDETTHFAEHEDEIDISNIQWPASTGRLADPTRGDDDLGTTSVEPSGAGEADAAGFTYGKITWTLKDDITAPPIASGDPATDPTATVDPVGDVLAPFDPTGDQYQAMPELDASFGISPIDGDGLDAIAFDDPIGT